jgi:hypothetical protein
MRKSKRQKRIISVSRRTDIPAFYPQWFMNRLRAGYCYAPNPLYPKQKTKPISLKPEDVEIIVFWTRDPRPLMKYLPELDALGYKYYFQYTILGYPRAIDPGTPVVREAVKTFKELSGRIGKGKVIWRYDPILFSNITPYQWHIDQISKIAKELKGKTERLVISFIDPYRKTMSRMKKETDNDFKLSPDVFNPESYRELAKWIGSESKKFNFHVVTCSEGSNFLDYGIKQGKCIDNEIISRILGKKISFKKDPAQREQCGCVVSKDIGANDTCLFGCKYCYATSGIDSAKKNFSEHNKKYPCLVSWYKEAAGLTSKAEGLF